MKVKIILIFIIFLAATLRLYRLGSFPATLYGDEQAFAYNAYSILMTGKDEYGISYPLQFRSFNDYKAPVPVYLLVPFIKIMGLNNFSVRFPIAIASVISVILSCLLAGLFLNRRSSLIVAFFMAVSPWHIHLSRGYFEATLSLAFFLAGIYLFLAAKDRLKYLFGGMLFFALSIYSYFTPRILLPFFLVFMIIFGLKYRLSGQENMMKVKKYLISLVFLIIISFPMVYATFFGQGLSRFNKLSTGMEGIVTETVNIERRATSLPQNWSRLFHNKIQVRLRLIKDNYLEHFSANFWYIYGDNSLRYFTGNMGMFYLAEFPFLLIGLYCLWKEKRSAAIFFSGWLLLAPIPAALVGRSFAVRSLAMLPAPFIFVAYGIRTVMYSDKIIKFRSIFAVMAAIITISSLGSLLIRYYKEYPVYAATWWGWENKAEIDYAKAREDDFDMIFLSDFYTGLPLAFATYNRLDPEGYRAALKNPVILADGRRFIQFGKYFIGSLDLNNERLSKHLIPPRSLYIGRPEEAESGENITAPDDGRVLFHIHKTK